MLVDVTRFCSEVVCLFVDVGNCSWGDGAGAVPVASRELNEACVVLCWLWDDTEGELCYFVFACLTEEESVCLAMQRECSGNLTVCLHLCVSSMAIGYWVGMGGSWVFGTFGLFIRWCRGRQCDGHG